MDTTLDGDIIANDPDSLRREKRRAYEAAWRERNREKRRACQAAYAKRNPEKRRAYEKAYRSDPENDAARKAYEKARRERDREKIAARQKAWRENNPEKVMAYGQTRCRPDREKLRASDKAWRENNPEKVRERTNTWRGRNPEKRRAHQIAALIPLPEVCERCGEQHELLHRHHPDYTKPLLVVILCPRCHKLAHKEINSAQLEMKRPSEDESLGLIKDDVSRRTDCTEVDGLQAEEGFNADST
jgi:hypothetical protein